MIRESVAKLQAGNLVRPMVGRYAGLDLKVIKVEMDSGAPNGWITVELPGSDGEGMYAGEEVARVFRLDGVTGGSR